MLELDVTDAGSMDCSVLGSRAIGRGRGIATRAGEAGSRRVASCLGLEGTEELFKATAQVLSAGQNVLVLVSSAGLTKVLDALAQRLRLSLGFGDDGSAIGGGQTHGVHVEIVHLVLESIQILLEAADDCGEVNVRLDHLLRPSIAALIATALDVGAAGVAVNLGSVGSLDGVMVARAASHLDRAAAHLGLVAYSLLLLLLELLLLLLELQLLLLELELLLLLFDQE